MSITGAYNKSDGDAIAKLIRDKLKIREDPFHTAVELYPGGGTG